MNKNLNKYGTDLDQLNAALGLSLAANKVLSSVKKNNILETYSFAAEKYNFPTVNPNTGELTKRTGPPWDVEGNTCEDIYIKIWVNPLNKTLLFNYLSRVKNWVYYSYRLSKSKNFLVSFFKFFTNMWKSKSHAYLYSEHLGFKIDSFTTIKYFIAEELLSEKLGGLETSLALMITDYTTYLLLHNQTVSEITDEYVEVYLDENYWRVNSYMWVDKINPTCFIVNEKVKKFDLKSGWSHREVMIHIERWFYFVTGQRIKVKNVKEGYSGKT